jgi:hypothetical protein
MIRAHVRFRRILALTGFWEYVHMQIENRLRCGTPTNRTLCTKSGRLHAEPDTLMPGVAQLRHVRSRSAHDHEPMDKTCTIKHYPMSFQEI